MIIQILILALLLIVIPVIVGGLAPHVDGKEPGLIFRWVSGQFFLWAGFQLLCVPLVLQNRYFSDVVQLFWGYTAALILLSVAAAIRHGAAGVWHRMPREVSREKFHALPWAVFAALLLFQLVQAVRMAYGDGDDAYYVAVSAVTQSGNTMYTRLPYTGFATALDTRHGLAPFPLWIAFLARTSGMEAAAVAHTFLPLVLISMTYAVFYLIGSRLFPDKDQKLPFFLIFTEILVLFGDYSFYTMENFMIARSRQGKAALGSIVIPFFFYLLMIFLQKLQEKGKLSPAFYVLFAAAAAAGCLCSSLGAFLICMLTGVTAALGAVCYKKIWPSAVLGCCCAPCVCYALLYIFYAAQ